jgi:hypothetical protein
MPGSVARTGFSRSENQFRRFSGASSHRAAQAAGTRTETRYADRAAGAGLSPNTVRKRVANAEQFLPDAVSRNILPTNPFVGLKHYWQVTDADFAKATRVEAAQKAAQQMHVEGRTESQVTTAAQRKTPNLPGSAPLCNTLPTGGVGRAGLEPVTSCMSSRHSKPTELTAR